MRGISRFYAPLLKQAIKLRVAIVAAAAVLVVLSGSLAARLGTEFIPNLDEGDIALHAMRIPGTSLTQAIGMQRQLEARIKEFPEVEKSSPRSAPQRLRPTPCRLRSLTPSSC